MELRLRKILITPKEISSISNSNIYRSKSIKKKIREIMLSVDIEMEYR